MEFEDRYDMLSRNYYFDMVDSYSAAFRTEVFIETGVLMSAFQRPIMRTRSFLID